MPPNHITNAVARPVSGKAALPRGSVVIGVLEGRALPLDGDDRLCDGWRLDVVTDPLESWTRLDGNGEDRRHGRVLDPLAFVGDNRDENSAIAGDLDDGCPVFRPGLENFRV